MINASDETLLEEERKKIKTERDQELEDIKALLAIPAGPRFFKKLFREGKLADISMTGNSWTFFNEGHRNYAKMIFNDVVEADHKAASKILAEILAEESKE